MEKPILVISGPTASGKSALALLLAMRMQAEIVGCDSVQIYKELSIGSAKPSTEDQKKVKHHLVDFLNPDQAFSVAEYVSRAKSVITELNTQNKQVILSGGTTLYLTHLLHGMAKLPPADPAIRFELEKLSIIELQEKLSECDPISYSKIHANDRVRIIRAVETFLVSGKPASELRSAHGYERESQINALVLVVMPPREILYERINSRSALMVKEGILEEAKNTINKYGVQIPPLQALGYSQACKVINGTLPIEQLETEIAMATRHYAKRQMTYWRNEPIKRKWQIYPEQVSDRHSKIKSFQSFEYDIHQLENAIEERFTKPLDGVEVWYVKAPEEVIPIGTRQKS